MNDREIRSTLKLLGFLEFRVVTQLLDHFVNKGLVCGFREPTFFVQEWQNTRWVRLKIVANEIETLERVKAYAKVGKHQANNVQLYSEGSQSRRLTASWTKRSARRWRRRVISEPARIERTSVVRIINVQPISKFSIVPNHSPLIYGVVQ